MSKDQTDSDDLFSDDYAPKKDNVEEKPDSEKINTDIGQGSQDVYGGEQPEPEPKEPKKDSSDDDWRIPDKQETPKPSRKKTGIVSGVVIIGVIIAIVYASGIITIPENVLDNMNPIELGESITKNIEEEKTKQPEQTTGGSGGTKDLSSTSDKVEIEKFESVNI